MTDPYLIPGTDVPRNKLGFTDRETLDRATHDIAESAALKLFASRRRAPPTMLGWQAVHRAMFGAVFDWAGQFRTIHIRKAPEGEQHAAWFVPFDRIAFEGAKATRNLAATLHHAASASLERIADNIADGYAQMNEVHPFREGNGRSQKVFFSLLCRPHNLQLRWDKIGAAEHNEAARKASAGRLLAHASALSGYDVVTVGGPSGPLSAQEVSLLAALLSRRVGRRIRIPPSPPPAA